MNDPRLRFRAHAVLFLATVASLAHAEGTWWYLALSVFAVYLGWRTTVRQDRPVTGATAIRILVIASFGFLVIEYFWLIAVPLLALSHFMTIVCACKLIYRRTLRDDAQLFVLTLLLLVVASIVSGHVLFLAVLVVFLTVGVEALVRFHLSVEAARVDAHNDRASPALVGAEPGEGERQGGRGLVVPLTLTSGVATAVGVALFIICPRVGAGMFGHVETGGGGHSVTHFATSMEFANTTGIKESNQPVMRVVLDYEGGPAPAKPERLYLRGMTLQQYARSSSGRGARWGWRRRESRRSYDQPITLYPTGEDEETAILVQPAALGSVDTVLVQRVWLEPTDERCLFMQYPPIELSSNDFERVEQSTEDGMVRLLHKVDRPVKYTVRSPLTISPALSEALADEAGLRQREEPPVLAPEPELPRQAEILVLIREVAGEPGTLADPQERSAFVSRLAEFLRSARFSYTLDPPSIRPGTEPIGEFLLRHRTGHCEYYASALAVMCQLSGIPARVVNGYAGGEYNPVGGGFHVIREKHAHAWTEVYVPGRDWVRFDPTPGSETGEGFATGWWFKPTAYLDYVQFQWANLVIAYDSKLRRTLLDKFQAWLKRPTQNERTIVGAVSAFVRELFGWRLKLTWSERLIYWVFTLLVVSLVVLVGYVVVVLLSWGWSWLNRHLRMWLVEGHRGREVEFYHRFSRRLEKLGFTRRRDQTPAEFAQELSRRFPALAEAPDVVQAYYQVMFGGRQLAPEATAHIETFLSRLGRWDGTRATPLE